MEIPKCNMMFSAKQLKKGVVSFIQKKLVDSKLQADDNIDHETNFVLINGQNLNSKYIIQPGDQDLRSESANIVLKNNDLKSHKFKNNTDETTKCLESNSKEHTVLYPLDLAEDTTDFDVMSKPPFSRPNGTKKMSHLLKRSPIDIEFHEINYCVENVRNKGYKTILKGISGDFRSGQLTAIMGPSGAGKSTLMDILAGYRTSSVSGEILINGKPRSLRSFRKQSCYIMQEDHLLPFLTVGEYMGGAAALKLGSEFSDENKHKLIEEILGTLKLADCKDTRVSNLSGGEKKRLSIASELINNPPIMFFDEPTSGLDSQNSYHCVSLLKSLAEEGRTIICTIHQPSARLFEKFDNLYALADGQCIYRGSVQHLVPFMSSLALECPSYHNPADFLVEVASGEYGNFIHKLVGAVNCGFYAEMNTKNTHSKRAFNLDLVTTSNGKCDDNDEKIFINEECVHPLKETSFDFPSCKQKFLPNNDQDNSSDYPSSFWTQFTVLAKRTFLSIVRDTMLTKLRIAAHIIVGIFIAILYYNIGNEASKVLSNAGCLFFSLMFLVFTAMMPTILTFPLEMNVFMREHLNHWYSLKSYYLAKTMADMPFQILFPLVYVLIVYFITNQPLETERFAMYTGFSVMTSLVAQSIGLSIGAAMNVQQAVFLGPSVAIPALLFSGFFVSFSTIPVYLRWLTYLSYIRYGYEGSLLAIYGGERDPLECSKPFCMFKSSKKILEQLGVEDNYLWLDFGLLVVYFLFMRGLGYIILRWKVRKER